MYEPVGYLRPYGLGVCSRRTEWSPPKAQGSVADKDLQQGIPYSKYFAHVSPSLDFPVRATVLSMTFCGLYGLIYLASSTAFNSIITSAVLYLVQNPFSSKESHAWLTTSNVERRVSRTPSLKASSSPGDARQRSRLERGTWARQATSATSCRHSSSR